MTHPRLIDQTAFYHIPAHAALKRTQHQNAEELPGQCSGGPAAPKEIGERHDEYHPDQAPKQAVEILPPEDALELAQAHVEVAHLEFGRLLVLLKRRLPLCIIERWNRADDRLPLDDRQAGMGKTRDAANDDHRK